MRRRRSFPVLSPFAVALALLAATMSLASVRPVTWPVVDHYGYEAYDSSTASCSASFVDIGDSGTPLVLQPSGAEAALDDGAAVVFLTEAFELYGRSVTSLVASTNGYLALVDSLDLDSGGDFSNDCPLPAIPEPGPAASGRILVLHDDLDGATGPGAMLSQYFATCPRPSETLGAEPCTVIQWDTWSTPSGGAFDVQAVLYHSSFEVAIQYRGTPPAAASIGIQDFDARTGLSPTCDGATLAAGPAAVCFFEPRFPAGGAEADLEAQLEDAPAEVLAGASAAYLVTITNNGPSPVSGATVAAVIDPAITCTWACDAGPGSSCTAGPVNGPLTDTVDVAPSSVLTYELTCPVEAGDGDLLSLTLTATTPAAVTDPVAANDTVATSATIVGGLFADDFETGNTTAWTLTQE
jgi:hypothetical protein